MKQPDFWSRIACGANGECWPWRAYRTKYGYGQFTLHRRVRYAHRYAWELQNGPIPKGMEVCHQCDNPPCCNPAHLFLGSQADNVRDMISKRRHCPIAPSLGERNAKARLTADRVRELRRLRAEYGSTYSDLGRQFGVNRSTAKSAIVGGTWKHVS